jgi:hypothetical protein
MLQIKVIAIYVNQSTTLSPPVGVTSRHGASSGWGWTRHFLVLRPSKNPGPAKSSPLFAFWIHVFTFRSRKLFVMPYSHLSLHFLTFLLYSGFLPKMFLASRVWINLINFSSHFPYPAKSRILYNSFSSWLALVLRVQTPSPATDPYIVLRIITPHL